MIIEINDSQKKREISREILEQLKEWFGIDESREQYIAESAEQIFLADMDNETCRGFVCLKETGSATVDLAVMGVKPAFHRMGAGAALVNAAKHIAKQNGYTFLQVKTAQMGIYPEYDKTNMFYKAMGFREFEVFKTLWDENNPCQIYVMIL